ncbi:Ndr family protein, partial [Opisthorchis viverrini]
GVKPKNAPVIVTIPDLGCNPAKQDWAVKLDFVMALVTEEVHKVDTNIMLILSMRNCPIGFAGVTLNYRDNRLGVTIGRLMLKTLGKRKKRVRGKLLKESNKPCSLVKELERIFLLALHLVIPHFCGVYPRDIDVIVIRTFQIVSWFILYDSRVLGALFIHGRCSQSGPLKLLRAKMRSWKSSHLEPATERYLLEHRFSTVSDSNLMEPLKSVFLQYKENLNTKVNAKNLNYLTYSYAHALLISDSRCPVLLITGTKSDHRSGVRHMYETMNKIHKTGGHSRTTVEMVEIEDSLSPLVDRSDKVAETALYFLQGLGIVTFVKSAPRKMSGDGAAGRLSWTGSPEKRTCEELKNLDLTTDHLTCSGDICRKQSDGSETSPKRLPPRYFSRQLSMAELDLPRGPGALITGRAIPPSCCPRNPSMDSHRRPSVEHSQH